jgi:hypothetical protein
MGHNVSNGKRRDNLVRSRLADLLEWTLEVRCPRCRDRRDLPIQEVVARCGGAHQLGDVLPRLRCSSPRCRTVPDSIIARSRLHSVILVGPGSYG